MSLSQIEDVRFCKDALYRSAAPDIRTARCLDSETRQLLCDSGIGQSGEELGVHQRADSVPTELRDGD